MSTNFQDRTLASKLGVVRTVSLSRLTRFANSDAAGCKETYLLLDEHFVGIRFSHGSFKAEWRLADGHVQFQRGSVPIGQVQLDEAARRAA